MSPKALTNIIILMSLATVGIIAMQGYSISRAITLNSELFDNNVHAALDNVVSKLEQVEIDETASLFNLPSLADVNDFGDVIVWEVEEISTALNRDSSKEQTYSSLGNLPVDSFGQEIFGGGTKRRWKSDGSANFMTHFTTYFTHHRIVQDVAIEKRMSISQLETVLEKTLKEKGLDADYAYGIYDIRRDTMLLRNGLCKTRIEDYQTRNDFKYRVNLFPSSHEEVAQLYVDFPSKRLYVWQGAGLNILGSILFIGVVIFCFYYTIKVILRQKKLSEMKNDFLNNMTHEFKTPIATISLATNAIGSLIEKGKSEKAVRFVNIIGEENQRMNAQVEKVLQMARIDKREFELKIVPIDAHEIIKKAAEHISLQVEQRQGKVHLDLQATTTQIEADKTHFTNIIHNLLDNANKYSPDQPHITIRTKNATGGMEIHVEDKGQGISKEARKHIFDKFYRVPTGDVHDVKGFGLGLSYVKVMMTAHEGTIDVQSELGSGSTFVLKFPYKHPNTQR